MVHWIWVLGDFLGGGMFATLIIAIILAGDDK